MEAAWCGTGLYSHGAFPRKEGGDWGADSVTARKESDDGIDLRRKALLTHGATLSVTARERRHDRAQAGPAAARWARPKREHGEGRERVARGEKKGERWAAGCAGLGRIREEK
jgi:hypothetical protein